MYFFYCYMTVLELLNKITDPKNENKKLWHSLSILITILITKCQQKQNKKDNLL